jgi:hypothetical protein
MSDIDVRIETLLREAVDADLGDRLTPRFDEAALRARAAARPPRRAAFWVLPFVAAAAVVAIAGGTVAIVQASGRSGQTQPGTNRTVGVPGPTAGAASASAIAERERLARERLAQEQVARERAAARAAAQRVALSAAMQGPWHGHDRVLTVTASGRASEMVTSGCCSPQLHITFALSNLAGSAPAGKPPAVTATGRVLSVRLDPGFTFDPGELHPSVGETGTVHLAGGVLTEPFTGTTYCARGVESCGA